MSIIDKNQLWLAIGILSILAASSSSAADKPGKDQSRRLQQQLRLAEQEKAKLNQKIVEAESQLKDIQEKSVSSKRLAEEASGRAARLKSDLDRLRSQAAADKESLTAKLTETERMLAELKLGFQPNDNNSKVWQPVSVPHWQLVQSVTPGCTNWEMTCSTSMKKKVVSRPSFRLNLLPA